MRADVALTASFGGGSENGTVSGSMRNFQHLDPEFADGIGELTTYPTELTLQSAQIGDSHSGFFTGDTAMTFDGSSFSESGAGSSTATAKRTVGRARPPQPSARRPRTEARPSLERSAHTNNNGRPVQESQPSGTRGGGLPTEIPNSNGRRQAPPPYFTSKPCFAVMPRLRHHWQESSAPLAGHHRLSRASLRSPQPPLGVLNNFPRPRVVLFLRASYTAAQKPRDGSGTVSASARRALPLKRRSG